jgi:hypothetical protein
MSDSNWKWAARELDQIKGGGPDGRMTMAEGTAMLQVLATRLAETVDGVRPSVDEYGTNYPPLPTMDWNRA